MKKYFTIACIAIASCNTEPAQINEMRAESNRSIIEQCEQANWCGCVGGFVIREPQSPTNRLVQQIMFHPDLVPPAGAFNVDETTTGWLSNAQKVNWRMSEIEIILPDDPRWKDIGDEFLEQRTRQVPD